MEKTYNPALIQRTQRYMETHSISQNQFAAKVNLSSAALSSYLNQKYKGSVEAVERQLREFFKLDEEAEAAAEKTASLLPRAAYVPTSISEDVTSVVRGAVNGIIRIINGMISAIVGGMNAVIGLLNGFSFDVPEFAQDALGTAKVGFNIDPITAPQIPYLAQGAVIPANHEFLAVLGDQTIGTNVEAPLETIQQALAEVLAEWGGQDITIRFAASGGLEQLVRLLMPYIDKEKVRRGARLVVGGN